MFKPLCFAALCFATFAATAADLTAQEVRWLKAAAPVLAYSQQLGLPVDITVQPEAGPNDVALAMGFADGRCKLVLSLRGNPDAESVLDGVQENERDVLIETMAAHELGHCWRYTQNAWHVLPAGFVAQAGADTETQGAQREEGYADLVALAWTRLHHGERYAQVFRWMSALRESQPVSGGSHDTRAWLKLAGDGERLGAVAQPFADVAPLWREGVIQEN